MKVYIIILYILKWKMNINKIHFLKLILMQNKLILKYVFKKIKIISMV